MLPENLKVTRVFQKLYGRFSILYLEVNPSSICKYELLLLDSLITDDRR